MKLKVQLYLLFVLITISNNHSFAQNSKLIPPHNPYSYNRPNMDKYGFIITNAPLEIQFPVYPFDSITTQVHKNRLAIKSSSSATYTYAQLAAMTPINATSTILAMSSISDLSDAFTYSQGASDFFHNTVLVDTLFSKLRQLGTTWTATDQASVTKMKVLVEVLRSGPYLGYYNSSMSDINTMTFKNKFTTPLLAIVNNSAWGWSAIKGTSATSKPIQDQVVDIIGAATGSGVTSFSLITKVTALLKTFSDSNMMTDPAKADAVNNLCNGMDYALYWSVVINNDVRETSMYYNQIGDYLTQITRIAKYGTSINSAQLYVEKNAFHWILNGCSYTMPKATTHQIILDCMNFYSMRTIQWLYLLTDISKNYSSDYSDLNLSKLKSNLQDTILPLKYTFDNGKFQYITGRTVSPYKIRMLYWATKEVRENFQSLVMRDTPLTTGVRSDDTLKAYVYSTPDDYTNYQPFFYGTDVNNGGMYIQSWGKFFTYERTNNTLSLEDLFRHEFTHYLQGRYLSRTVLGSGDMYANNRMNWIVEGGAEFQAASTRYNGITQRKNMVQQINSDKTKWLKISDLKNISYSTGFDFYTYAYVLYHFLLDNHPDQLFKMFTYIQSSNITQLDNLISTWATNYETEYETYMTNLQANVNSYTNIVTPLNYYTNIQPRLNQDIFNEIASTAGLTDVQTSTYSSPSFNTYEVRGTYVLGTTVNQYTDRSKMFDSINSIIKNKLTTTLWYGYKTLTGHLVGYRIVGTNAVFTLSFSGLLPAEPPTPTKDISMNNENITLLQNYPNPAKNNCTIAFNSTIDANISLNIYNLNGELVMNVLNRHLNAGNHTASVDLSNFSDGIYFYTLQANEKKITKKMVVVK